MARLNKKEREIYTQVINEWTAKDPEVSGLRIVFEIRSCHGLRRHTQRQQFTIVKRMMKNKKRRT